MSLNAAPPSDDDSFLPIPPSPPPKKTRKKRQPNKPVTTEEKLFKDAGANFTLNFHMHLRPGGVVQRVWLRNEELQANPEAVHYEPITPLDKEAWSFLLATSPALAMVVQLGKDIEGITKICRWLDMGSVTQRHTDTNTIRNGIYSSFGVRTKLGCLPFTPHIEYVMHRGYKSHQTGCLLTPNHMSWSNREDRALLKTEGTVVEPNTLFRFLYPNGEVNPDDEKAGLMEGELVYKPYARLYPREYARGTMAASKVTKHGIAYVIALVHHGLSGSTKINSEFDQFDHYDEMRNFLDEPENRAFWDTLKIRLPDLVYPAVIGRRKNQQLVESQEQAGLAIDQSTFAAQEVQATGSDPASAPSPTTIPTAPASPISPTHSDSAAQPDTAHTESETAHAETETAHAESETAHAESETAQAKSETAHAKSNAARVESDIPSAQSDTTQPPTVQSGTAQSDTTSTNTAQLNIGQPDTSQSDTNAESDTRPVKRRKGNGGTTSNKGVHKAIGKGGRKSVGNTNNATRELRKR